MNASRSGGTCACVSAEADGRSDHEKFASTVSAALLFWAVEHETEGRRLTLSTRSCEGLVGECVYFIACPSNMGQQWVVGTLNAREYLLEDIADIIDNVFVPLNTSHIDATLHDFSSVVRMSAKTTAQLRQKFCRQCSTSPL